MPNQKQKQKTREGILLNIKYAFEHNRINADNKTDILNLQDECLKLNNASEMPLSTDEVIDLIESFRQKYSADQYKDNKNKKEEKAGKRHKKFDYIECADLLLYKHGLTIINETPALFNGRHWVLGMAEIIGIMQEEYGAINSADRNEVFLYLKNEFARGKLKNIIPDNKFISFENGVIDTETGELLNHGEQYYTSNTIPHKYRVIGNDEIKNSVVNRFMHDIACYDQDTVQQLYELIGACLYSGLELNRFVLLSGSGSNGKSTFLDLIQTILGDDNYSNVGLSDVACSSYEQAMLVGKLVNIGAEIPAETMSQKECSVIKSLVFGDRKTVREIYKAPISFRPYAIQIYSCNELPKFKDSSEGFYRRLLAIPFNARFSLDNNNIDLHMSDKLNDEREIEIAIYLGINAFMMALKRESYNVTRQMQELENEIRTDSNSVLQWIASDNIAGDMFNGCEGSVIYDKYRDWCSSNGYSAYSFTSPKFYKIIQNELKLEKYRSGNKYKYRLRKNKY